MELNIHPVQVKILKTLLFSQYQKFTDLNKANLSTDHFNFHVKRLLTDGLIEKTSGRYALTPKGKEFANRLDTDKEVIERQPKMGVVVSIAKKEGRQIKYLIQQRLKQPYYGYHGAIGGKVRWGESIMETAKRELAEESGLTCPDLRIMGVEHKSDYDTQGKLLEDKVFFRFFGTKPEGKLKENFEGGKNMWLTEEELFKKEKVFGDLREFLELFKKSAKSKGLAFVEHQFTVSDY